MIEVEDKFSISSFTKALLLDCACAARLKLGALPYLPFVLSKVLNSKWLYAGYRQQPLAGSMNRKSAQIASDPLTIEPLSYRSSSTAASRNNRARGLPHLTTP